MPGRPTLIARPFRVGRLAVTAARLPNGAAPECVRFSLSWNVRTVRFPTDLGQERPEATSESELRDEANEFRVHGTLWSLDSVTI